MIDGRETTNPNEALQRAVDNLQETYERDLRFRKFPGGAIVDGMTGTCLAHVMVSQLDTATADRLSDVIIAALYREFGGRSVGAEGAR